MKNNNGQQLSKLMHRAIQSLSADNFSDMVDNCKADIRSMVSGFNESELVELATMITSLLFLTSDIMKGHEYRNRLVIKDYLKQTIDLTIDEIETFVKPDFLRYAILELLNNKSNQKEDNHV